MSSEQNGSFYALMPLFIFIFLFIGSGIITKDFYSMPINVAVIIASIVALSMNRKIKLNEKIKIYTKGAGHENIVLMVFIFILAGAFSEVAKGMGAVESTVNLGLSFLSPSLLMVGLFVIGCFLSITMGTSVGTVVALAPIGIAIAEQADIAMALAMATVVGGAMFGDNLSIISDTTIAATKTQNTDMKDKFKTNFFIVLPGAILTAIILYFITSPNVVTTEEYSWDIVKVLPYLIVLIVALLGVNVFIVLIGGTLFAGILGIIDGSYTIPTLFKAISNGIIEMQDIAIISLLIGGLMAIIQHNGGIQYLLYLLTKKIKSKKGAELGIAGLVSAADISTANNTISIIVTGPLAKKIADKYEIEPRKSASILDIFASSMQGLLPYGAQILAAAGLAAISPVAIMGYSIYPVLLGISGIIAILIGYPKKRK